MPHVAFYDSEKEKSAFSFIKHLIEVFPQAASDLGAFLTGPDGGIMAEIEILALIPTLRNSEMLNLSEPQLPRLQ